MTVIKHLHREATLVLTIGKKLSSINITNANPWFWQDTNLISQLSEVSFHGIGILPISIVLRLHFTYPESKVGVLEVAFFF